MIRVTGTVSIRSVIMHPENAKIIAKQHHEDLRRLMVSSRRALPRGWRVSWSRTVLSDATRRRRSSLVIIIISARRAA
jgi:hypothetical protein